MTASQQGSLTASQQIARDIQAILLRYRAGMLNLTQAKQELAFQQALLKAYELAEIEARLERIEASLAESEAGR